MINTKKSCLSNIREEDNDFEEELKYSLNDSPNRASTA